MANSPRPAGVLAQKSADQVAQQTRKMVAAAAAGVVVTQNRKMRRLKAMLARRK